MNPAAYFVVALCSSLASAPLDLEQVQADFQAANERALAGEAATAIALYRSILNRGALHEDVLFNLGVALTEQGKWLDAIVAYERARRLAPWRDDIPINLDIVRSRLLAAQGFEPSREEAVGPLGLADAIAPVVSRVPEPLAVALAIGSQFALFLGLAFARLSTSAGIRPVARAVAPVAAALLFAALAFVAGHAILAAQREAVNLRREPVRDGPHARFPGRHQSTPGLRVRILATEGDWQKVQLADGASGWLPADAVEPL